MLGSITAFAALSLAGTAALYEGLVVRKYTITTRKWQRGNTLRFVLMSDLHSTLFGKGQREILSLVRELRPDHILLAGDIVDEHRPPIHAHMFLSGVAHIAPTWYALGNHEYRSHCVPAIVRMVERCGVRALLDSSEQLQTPAGPLLIAGCEDPEKMVQQGKNYSWLAAMRHSFADIRGSGLFTVLIAHHPEHSALYGKLGFDLAVSGHAHGGQVRIPFLLNGLAAPDQGAFPQYAGGLYWQGSMAHIVSRGTVVYHELPRIFNPPEIAVIEVRGTCAGCESLAKSSC